ncbi:hypothetical protein HAX54_007886, partial [Datura stramonium]|nr:hypothetical protein [Datura stramonium]
HFQTACLHKHDSQSYGFLAIWTSCIQRVSSVESLGFSPSNWTFRATGSLLGGLVN